MKKMLYLIFFGIAVGFALHFTAGSKRPITSSLKGEDGGRDYSGGWWTSVFMTSDEVAAGCVDMVNLADPTDTDDIYYSPIYSHLPCNVYHDPFEGDESLSDDDWASASLFDDDWPSSSWDD